MINTQFYENIEFDLDSEINVTPLATQGDTGSRGIYITLIMENLKEQVLRDCSMKFFALKPNNERVSTDAIVDGTRFRIDHKEETFLIPGTLTCSLVLYDKSGSKIADKKFEMVVEPSIEEGAVMSRDINLFYSNDQFTGNKRLFGNFNTMYHTPSCTDVSLASSFKLKPSKIQDIYSQYDSLMALNTLQMKKNLLGYGTAADGTEDRTLPIYEYVISNPSNGEKTLPNNSPTILITTGVHGDEKGSVWSTLQFFKQLMGSWSTSDSLASIKSNVNFKVIPILNPYGFNTDIRRNARGVDLNRNMGFRWGNFSGDKGTSVFSEQESKVFEAWLSNNFSALTYIDFHNQVEDLSFSYLSCQSDEVKNIYGSLIRRLSDKWKNKYSDLRNNFSYGYTVGGINRGLPTTTNYAYHTVGIETALTLEVAWARNGVYYTSEVIEKGVDILANMLLGLLDMYNRG